MQYKAPMSQKLLLSVSMILPVSLMLGACGPAPATPPPAVPTGTAPLQSVLQTYDPRCVNSFPVSSAEFPPLTEAQFARDLGADWQITEGTLVVESVGHILVGKVHSPTGQPQDVTASILCHDIPPDTQISQGAYSSSSSARISGTLTFPLRTAQNATLVDQARTFFEVDGSQPHPVIRVAFDRIPLQRESIEGSDAHVVNRPILMDRNRPGTLTTHMYQLSENERESRTQITSSDPRNSFSMSIRLRLIRIGPEVEPRNPVTVTVAPPRSSSVVVTPPRSRRRASSRR